MKRKENGSTSPTVSVVVLTLNEEATVDRCLESIINQRFPDNRFEIVVVDGNSTDKTREIAGRYTPKVLVEDRHNFGYARNLGVHSAKGRYVAFISADAWAEPGWLEGIHSTLSSRELAGLVGRQVPITYHNWVSKIRSSRFKKTYTDKPGQMKKGDNFSTVNCAYTIEAILKNGGFDETLPACEDQDLAHRILQSNLKIIYDPTVTVHHAAEESLGEICKKTFRQGIGEGICSSRYQIWSEKLYFSVLLLAIPIIFPLALLTGIPQILVESVAKSLAGLFLLALTWNALQVIRETRDWRTLLGTYIYYPAVALAELSGFLIGRLTAHDYPIVKRPPM